MIFSTRVHSTPLHRANWGGDTLIWNYDVDSNLAINGPAVATHSGLQIRLTPYKPSRLFNGPLRTLCRVYQEFDNSRASLDGTVGGRRKLWYTFPPQGCSMY